MYTLGINYSNMNLKKIDENLLFAGSVKVFLC